MATRLYPSNTGATGVGAVAPVTVTPDAGWEQSAIVDSMVLEATGMQSRMLGITQSDVAIPNTTTQDILCDLYFSPPLAAQNISGTYSQVLMIWESSTNNNCFLAVVAKLVSQIGATKGTLFATFSTGIEFNNSAAKSTRIVSAGAVTATDCAAGDRIIVEIGAHAAAPVASGVVSMNSGYTPGVADYALTSGLTTALNPWVEFSQNLQFLKQPRGVSRSGRFHR